MKVKYVVMLKGQEYTRVKTETFITKAGNEARVMYLRSRCPDCGDKFTVTTTKNQLRGGSSLNRRCQKCKRPGKRVQ